MKSKNILLIIVLSICSISIGLSIEASSLNKDPIKFTLNFQKGEIRNYRGLIEITDISGIPTEGSGFGNEDVALIYNKYSIPYTFQEEIIKIDEAGTATIRITKNILLEDFKSLGRDNVTIENVKQALKTLHLESYDPRIIERKNNGVMQKKRQKDLFNEIAAPLFPNKAMGVGDVYSQTISNSLGIPIERYWTFKEVISENSTNFAILEIARSFEASIPYQDIFRKVNVEDINKVTFNLDGAFVQKQEILKHIKTDLVDNQERLLGGNSRAHTIVKITEYLEKKK